jgi:hypothetical protein
MPDDIKPFCPHCIINEAQANRYKKRYEAMQGLLYHTKENLADSIELNSPVQAISLFNFIEKRLSEINE